VSDGAPARSVRQDKVVSPGLGKPGPTLRCGSGYHGLGAIPAGRPTPTAARVAAIVCRGAIACFSMVAVGDLVRLHAGGQWVFRVIELDGEYAAISALDESWPSHHPVRVPTLSLVPAGER
jgi:hypothetical protein